MRIVFMGTEYSLRLSGAAAKNLAAALWSVATTKQKTKGKARLASLLKSGKELKVFNITQGELAALAKEAKRYGVLYAVVKPARNDPSAMVDVMVRAEDAAKINRIIERLEYASYDATDVVVEAKRDLEQSQVLAPAVDGFSNESETDKGEAQKDAGDLLDWLLTPKQDREGTPTPNPTVPLADAPPPSEHSSNKGGKTAAEENAPENKGRPKQEDAASRSGFHDGRERRSVKAQIDEKRERREQSRAGTTAKAKQQTLHQSTPQRRRKTPRDKTMKGR